MTEYIFDERGKWQTLGDVKILVEPSEQYINTQNEQQALQEFKQSLQPSPEETEKAKFELKTITLLYELGVI